MKKIKLKVVVPIIILIELCFVFFSVFMCSDRGVNKISKDNEINKKMFAMYLQNDEGTYEVVKNNNYWPNEVYELNETKTVCVDKDGENTSSVVKFVNNKMVITSNKTVYCHLYFDKRTDVLIEISTDEVAGVIPSTLGYSLSIGCDSGNVPIWNSLYNRLEFSSLNVDDTKCSLAFVKSEGPFPTLIDTVVDNATVIADGYRYNGQNPNNFIWFNGYMYRIIGYLPVKAEDGTQTNLVKIIRETSLGRLAYDAKASNQTGAWGSNTLFTHLNTHFYATSKENLNGQNSAGCYGWQNLAQSNCNYIRKGILSTNSYGKMIEKVYWNTGAASYQLTAGAAYQKEILNQSVLGYVGLMSVSDYGYAADTAYHSTKMQYYSATDLLKSNWIFLGEYELTSTQYSDSSDKVLYIDHTGSLFNRASHAGFAVRPVFYLDPTVYVISGDGTAMNPYQIAM